MRVEAIVTEGCYRGAFGVFGVKRWVNDVNGEV